jgi:hypothetical protein
MDSAAVIACNPQLMPQIPIPVRRRRPRVPSADDAGDIHAIPVPKATPNLRTMPFDFWLRRRPDGCAATYIDATLDPSPVRKEGRAR